MTRKQIRLFLYNLVDEYIEELADNAAEDFETKADIVLDFQDYLEEESYE